jgi:hypothetical protein
MARSLLGAEVCPFDVGTRTDKQYAVLPEGLVASANGGCHSITR